MGSIFCLLSKPILTALKTRSRKCRISCSRSVDNTRLLKTFSNDDGMRSVVFGDLQDDIGKLLKMYPNLLAGIEIRNSAMSSQADRYAKAAIAKHWKVFAPERNSSESAISKTALKVSELGVVSKPH